MVRSLSRCHMTTGWSKSPLGWREGAGRWGGGQGGPLWSSLTRWFSVTTRVSLSLRSTWIIRPVMNRVPRACDLTKSRETHTQMAQLSFWIWTLNRFLYLCKRKRHSRGGHSMTWHGWSVNMCYVLLCMYIFRLYYDLGRCIRPVGYYYYCGMKSIQCESVLL